jgi:hypothetical protein
VSQEYNWISATPDGILVNKNDVSKIACVEVKAIAKEEDRSKPIS